MSDEQYNTTVEQCAEAHTKRTGHKAGGSNGYADCAGCGEEWHWPITQEQWQAYLRDTEREVPMLPLSPGPLKPPGCTCVPHVFSTGRVEMEGIEDCPGHGPIWRKAQAKREARNAER